MKHEDCSCICHIPESQGIFRGWCKVCKELHPPTNLPKPDECIPTVDEIIGDWICGRILDHLNHGQWHAFDLVREHRNKYFAHVQVWAKGV
jgi:hypothetical protein